MRYDATARCCTTRPRCECCVLLVKHLPGENHRAFGAEVRTLYGSLTKLDNAVTRTQQPLKENGAKDWDLLGADRSSLDEIIGDYEATLNECQQLLERNRRYSQTTGPVRNIEWNINIMPRVDYLRSRIRMHTSRIEHVLKPFEMYVPRKLNDI